MFQDRGESKRLTLTNDADKLSVKKLIEEEMIIDQDEIKDQGNAEVESPKVRDRITANTEKNKREEGKKFNTATIIIISRGETRHKNKLLTL